MIAEGRIGAIRHVRAVYLQDWIVDPQFPLVWRLQQEVAGSGALGDIGAHIIDMAQFVSGQLITGVSAVTETFISERPLPVESSGLSASTGNGTGSDNGVEPARDGSPWTMPRCSWRGWTVVDWRPSRRPGSPPATRTACAWR